MRFLRKAALMMAPIVVMGVAVSAPVGASPPSGASTTNVPKALPSVVPGLAKVGQVVSSVMPSTPINFSLMVKGPHDAQLAGLAQQVSDPSSSEFRHFLSRSQLINEYDPPAALTATVVAGLRALGITVVRTSSDGRLVDAEGSAGLLSSVLGLHFAYVKAVGEALERVALNQPVFPALLRPLISDVVGLSATPVQTFDATSPVVITTAPAAAYFNARPCAAYYNQI